MIKKNAYSVKSISIDSVVACVLAGISLMCQIGALIISYRYEGNGPRAVGLLGVGGFITALMGIVFAKSAWKSPDGGVFMKRIALIANIIMLVLTLVLYVIGWM